MKESKKGKIKLAYCSPFVPAEWIAAHGLTPVVFRPGGTERGGLIENRAGTCAFMRAFINEATQDPEIDGLIVTTVCDQMRRSVDVLADRCEKPVFLMHVPATWQTAAAYEYYILELKRLGRFLVRRGGEEPSSHKLVSTMAAFEKGRAEILANPNLLKGDELTHALKSLFERGAVQAAQSKSASGVPVAVVGGPLSREDSRILNAVEKLGGMIALDGTENGERMLPGRFNKRELADDPLGALATAYFAGIPDVFKRPNNELFIWLERQICARDIKGVILVRYVFCDCWHAEVSRIREWINVPVVDLDLTGRNGEVRTMTRIAAFMEALA
jgi:benzoyl-CoA reductase/2-hydroxyglutaryl-CoA dehydratase subunit BcrC/BadD/HgdB